MPELSTNLTPEVIAAYLRKRGQTVSLNAAVDELRDALAAAEKLVGGRGERLPTWGHRR